MKSHVENQIKMFVCHTVWFWQLASFSQFSENLPSIDNLAKGSTQLSHGQSDNNESLIKFQQTTVWLMYFPHKRIGGLCPCVGGHIKRRRTRSISPGKESFKLTLVMCAEHTSWKNFPQLIFFLQMILRYEEKKVFRPIGN